MKTKRTYHTQYTKTLVGYRLTRSRTGNGRWKDGTTALPDCITNSLDRTVARNDDAELAAIYEGLFHNGKDANVAGSGYSFTVTGDPSMRLTFRGTMEVAELPLDPAPADLMESIDRHSTGRWHWEKAHLCITGKDADLEPSGYQAAEILGIRGKYVHCIAHIGKTFAGSDVSLNLRDGQNWSDAIKLYLDQAGEIVCGCACGGDWSGDDWFMSEAIPFRVKIRKTPDETSRAIQAGVVRALKNVERELRLADSMLDTLAGWRDQDGKHYDEGSPCKGSVSDMLASQKEVA